MKSGNNRCGEGMMRKEYDFSGGIRGKHCKAYRKSHAVRIRKNDGTVEKHYFTEIDGSVMLDPDIRGRFPDSQSVNKALREYIATH